jgi:hypothetical protein
VLDREPREADALLPDELVALALALHHLASAAGEDQHGLAPREQRGAVLASAAHGAEPPQHVAPDRHGEMVVVAEPANQAARLVQDREPQHRDVDEPVDGVIAGDQHRSLAREVLEADRNGREEPPQWLGDRAQGVGRNRLEVDVGGIHGAIPSLSSCS